MAWEQEIIKGLHEKRNVNNRFYVTRVHYTADPEKATLEWIEKTKAGMPKTAWQKEYEIDFYALSGQKIWPEFDPYYHVIKPFQIPKEWTRLRGIDFGQYNPTCCLWAAINYDGDVYIYQEYYQGGRITAATHAKAIAEMSRYKNDSGEWINEDYIATYIDPSTRAKNQSKKEPEALDDIPYSVFEIFHDNGVDCYPANNDTRAGWDRVSEYLKLQEYKDGLKPKLYIFENCTNLIWEIPHYRYSELSPLVAERKDPEEKQIKKRDHACDALRYLIISHLPIPDKPEKELTFLQKDLKRVLNQHKSAQVQAWAEWNT